jgi:hypothetical protein
MSEQVIKPNKFPACESIHQMYYECSIVTEASFGKFINRCAGLKEKLDECNVQEQVWAQPPHPKQAAPPHSPANGACITSCPRLRIRPTCTVTSPLAACVAAGIVSLCVSYVFGVGFLRNTSHCFVSLLDHSRVAAGVFALCVPVRGLCKACRETNTLRCLVK